MMMKSIIFAAALICTGIVSGQTSKLNQLFDRYQNSEGVTSIRIAKPMFQLLNQLDIEDSDLSKIKPLINKINSLQILIVERDSSNSAGFDKLQAELSTALKGLNYEELMSINGSDNTIKILAESTKSNLLSNLLLSIRGADETMFMILDGEISMEDVSKLISNE